MFLFFVIILCVVIFALSLAVFSYSNLEETGVGLLCLLVFTLFILILGFDYNMSKNNEYYYKLGQEDAVNGRIHYQIETTKILR